MRGIRNILKFLETAWSSPKKLKISIGGGTISPILENDIMFQKFFEVEIVGLAINYLSESRFYIKRI